MWLCGVDYRAFVPLFRQVIVVVGCVVLAMAIVNVLMLSSSASPTKMARGRWKLFLAVSVAVVVDAIPMYMFRQAMLNRTDYWFYHHQFLELGLVAGAGLAAVCSVPCARASGPWWVAVRIGSWALLVLASLGFIQLAFMLVQMWTSKCGLFMLGGPALSGLGSVQSGPRVWRRVVGTIWVAFVEPAVL